MEDSEVIVALVQYHNTPQFELFKSHLHCAWLYGTGPYRQVVGFKPLGDGILDGLVSYIEVYEDLNKKPFTVE